MATKDTAELQRQRRSSIVTTMMTRRSSSVSATSGAVHDLFDTPADCAKNSFSVALPPTPTPILHTTTLPRASPQSCPASPGHSVSSSRIEDSEQQQQQQQQQGEELSGIPSNASTNTSRRALSVLVRRLSTQYIPAASLPTGHPAFEDSGPSLELHRFGRRWAVDLFVLFNNAARRQLRDLHRAIGALKLKLNNGCLHLQDFADFFVWFAHVRAFMSEMFVVQETVIFPWLESVIPMEGPLTKEERMLAQNAIMRDVQSIERLRKKDHVKVAMETILSIANLADGLSQGSKQYFEILEERCPPLVEMFFSPELTTELGYEIRNKLMKGKNAQVVFPILVHWMAPRDSNDWVVKNMKGGRKLMMFYWQKNFERTHGSVLNRVCKTDSL